MSTAISRWPVATQRVSKYFILVESRLYLLKFYEIHTTYAHISFEFQTRNYITCFGHICNHPHGQENHTLKYINMVLITVMTYR